MPKLARTALILLTMLVPSAVFAWRNRELPEFGYLHDDGLLFISAKSLAVGDGYRIESLPENPPQTKFPPLYPLYLSLIWRINPQFPDNLRLATLFSWVVLTACLVLTWLYYRTNGLSDGRAGLLVCLMGLSPYLILFGCTMFSEVFFTCWVLVTLLLVRRGGWRMAALAGIVAGGAYLSRTAGIALLVSVPAWMAWNRDWRRAGAFVAGMLPAIIAWTLWTRTHMSSSYDQTVIYYTDYIAYQFLNVRLDNFAVVLWKNLDQILYGMGSMVLPKVLDMLPVKILTQVIGVAMISGVVRMARKGIAVEYALFGLVSTGILMVWHFPPNERFILPLYPLLLAGLIFEIEHLWQMLKLAFRHRDFGQRVVAVGFAAVVGIVLAAALALQAYVTFQVLPESAAQKAVKLRDLRATYDWISANLPASATVLSYDDPLLYLYTSRRGNYLPLLPRWWYSEDHGSIVAAYRDVVNYCRRRNLTYFYFTTEDLQRETGDQDRQEIEASVRKNPELTPIFQAGIGTLYKIGN